MLFSLFLLGQAIFLSAQEEAGKVSDADWDKLIPHLQNEEWAKAEKICKDYLKRFTATDDSLAEPAILRYMYIKCVGARLGAKEYEKSKAEALVKDMVGKTIITPYRQFKEKCLFNCFNLSEEKDHLFATSSNNEATVIHCFEHYFLEEQDIIANPEGFEGKNLRIAGFVKSIAAGGSAMPRLDIEFEHCFIWDIEE